VERVAESYGASFEEVNAFITEIDFLPSHIFPGRIGGHCVMPNIELLQQRIQSQFLDTVVLSNAKKEQAPRFPGKGGISMRLGLIVYVTGVPILRER